MRPEINWGAFLFRCSSPGIFKNLEQRLCILESANLIQFMPAKLAQFASRTVQFRRQNRAAFLISAALCIVSVALYGAVYLRPHPNPFLQFLVNIELKTLDVRFQLRGARAPGPAVVIVAIDQKSQDVLGRWPFPRSYFAQAVDFLREAHARVIAFDMNFPQVDANSGLEALRSVRQDYEHLVAPPLRTPAFESKLKSREAAADNDRQFADALSHFDNAILGYFFISPEEAKSQNQERLKQFLDMLSYQAYPQVIHPEYAKNFGVPEAHDLPPICRSLRPTPRTSGSSISSRTPTASCAANPPWWNPSGKPLPLPGRCRRLGLHQQFARPSQAHFQPERSGENRPGPAHHPDRSPGFVQLDYDGVAGTFPTYSLADVVAAPLPPSDFDDRLVIIGLTAPASAVWRSPLFSPSKISRRGSSRQHDRRYSLSTFYPARSALSISSTSASSFCSAWERGLLFSVLNPLRATAFWAVPCLLFFWLTYYLFAHYRMWVADFLPMTTLSVTYAGIVSYRFFFEEGEKKKVRSAFSQYLHPGLINQMLTSPEGPPAGRRRKGAYGFIRGHSWIYCPFREPHACPVGGPAQRILVGND